MGRSFREGVDGTPSGGRTLCAEAFIDDAGQNTMLAVLAIGIALALPAGRQMLLSNLRQIAHHNATKPQISLYLSLNADRDSATNVLANLTKHPAVGSAELLPREATLKRMRQSPGLKDVIDALPGTLSRMHW